MNESNVKSRKRVAIVGATGYSGAELTAILARHAEVELVALFSSSSTARGPVTPTLPQFIAEPFSIDGLIAAQPEIVFLATPNEVSAGLAPQLLDLGMRVIDLSGAFRLEEPSMYPTWYGFDHERPNLLGEAVYGLTEYCNGELKNARLVANPGCYPTSILLALRPLTFAIDREQPVICDSKSGVSGAGKKADVNFSFAELFGNFKAYGVGNHRHEPEIRQQLHLGDRAPVVFVAHLLPVHRGILSTMHIGFTHPMSEQQITDAYTRAYEHAPFVRVLPAGQLPELKNVVNTPRADIGFQLLHGGRRAVIVSVIDNLLKGAASQAVQNFNRMCGFPETEALV
ncbi:MAG TPA: N-acetyl-gamma-glutamyl-phosphate reductase [Thermoanaerobaculia bacterium]|jgi:N-acetyl-gamma-glutamyl-phosphate reductase|nr:N-acetyl-gamma-glutamyl-phosphate reductase [Thermoanaerobaculia bacterium]